MAKNLGLLIILIASLSLFSTPKVSSSSTLNYSRGLDWWCNQTPYPETCKYSWRRHKSPRSNPRQKSDFKKIELEITLQQALEAEGRNSRLGRMCRNRKERAAWLDCLRLFDDAVFLLNRTLTAAESERARVDTAVDDSQTWLSAALTSFDTCRTGFAELGVPDLVLPLMSTTNVSRLVSNALSVDAVSAAQTPPPVAAAPAKAPEEGFPKWMSPKDRRLLQATGVTPNLVVAKDGSGTHRTIKAALDAAGSRSGSGRFVIQVKSGVYSENLDIGRSLKNVMLIGDGLRTTIITGNRSVGGGSTTFNSATVAVTAEGFIARGITFRNTAGAANHQAVALRSGADLSVFYRCGFEGYQDTLYAHSNRQFYKECYIYGTIDFIFGNAAAVFQNCMIYGRRPMSNQVLVVTAQGRLDPNQNTGISIHNSRVMPAPDLVPVLGSFRAYLGRPWKQYSRTVVAQTYLESFVNPAGWLEWDGEFALGTLFYAEYKNMGPGSPTGSRVKWKGYRVLTSASQALPFMAANFIDGNSWLPATGVPFTAGL